ncbi:conserved hypothetical protein [Aspergillus terreus NIH2624]|uniref:Rhodopsin domain-containing protein n=1 Tax=Aspergillus terreus (strain NIH 2624 / FGSC A1156) TaxID=341663 RepID=Q0CKA5_ASPTN|nr:uncharacterized protein ATEG_05879 [Aspergillus terreus NIH2624]EAU33640.1 conserved hypothetical protein [Aspergillus terreus NIH2624]
MAIGTPRGQHALTVSAVFTSLATFFTILRIYTRAFIVKQMGADDWTILVSLVFTWAFFAIFVQEVRYLMGEHLDKIPHDVYVKQMKYFWASVPIYQTTLIVTKASILLQYKRVFSTPRMRLACWGLIGFLGVYGTWTILSAWLNCLPLAKFWDDTVKGFCLDKKALWFSNSAIHIFTDILILVYPMPVLKNLQVPRRQKIALMAVFALGAFVLVTSILRLQSLLVISNSTDPTYDNPGAATWSAVECNVAIICACLPGTRALISRLLPRFLSTRSGNYNTYNYHTKSNNPARSRSTHNLTNHFQTSASVAAPDYTMKSFTRPDSTSSKESGKHPPGEIKVTTIVSQEFASHTDDASSVRHLV